MDQMGFHKYFSFHWEFVNPAGRSSCMFVAAGACVDRQRCQVKCSEQQRDGNESEEVVVLRRSLRCVAVPSWPSELASTSQASENGLDSGPMTRSLLILTVEMTSVEPSYGGVPLLKELEKKSIRFLHELLMELLLSRFTSKLRHLFEKCTLRTGGLVPDTMGDGGVADTGQNVNQSHVLFDRFVQASTCKGTLKAFQELCDFLELKPNEYRIFYHKLKTRLNYWKAKALWAKLDKRACLKDYKKGRACINTKCLIIGAGPCGLRTAIELAFLGAKVVLLEKRDAFSRNNVLHLWPFTIQDLRGLGAKKFYGKFCAGAIDHISIRQLQLILLKVALLLGIEIHVNVEFRRLIEPPEDQENERIGWRAEVHPRTHPVNEFEFDVIIGADGRRNTLPGFRRKEFRGKLAIAITANFINRNTTAEAKVEEISGVAFIFNQKFFQDLREATGIDLENIVYYKDDTHYFVMTAKKQSLLDKGVILHDYADTELLLSRANVDQTALLAYARQAADFSTNRQLPQLDFAINHYGQPDVAMFDFTCMYASENAALVRQRNSHQLLVALVGDSLLEPFWPMGTGIARGFLAAMDSAWMVRSWAQGNSALEVLAERESIYRLLPQTTPENVSKNFSQYSVDPTTRYPNISLHFLRPNQVRHLIDTGESRDLRVDMENVVNASTPKLLRNDSIARSSKLLSWCQRQTNGYRNIAVTDLTMSWKSGLALCAIIHRYRPDLIDFDCLEEWNQEKNNQLAFDVAEREFGISPIMTGKEMASVGEPDKLSMVMYLSQFYEMFKDTVPPGENHNLSPEEKAALIASTKSPISFLSKLGQSISRKRNPKDKKEKDTDGTGKRRKTSLPGLTEDEEVPRGLRGDRPLLSTALTERRMDAVAGGNNNKPLLPPPLPSVPPKDPVRLAPVPAWRKRYVKMYTGGVSLLAEQITNQLQSQEEPKPLLDKKELCSLRKEFPQNVGGSDVCFFCHKRVYVMERLSAEGKFFHRSCFICDYCGTTLRLSSYAFDLEDGKFYCKPHYCYRLSGQAQRKRPAPANTPLTIKEDKVALTTPTTVESPGRVMATAAPNDLRPPVAEVNGVLEAGLAKRPRGTPERIELENYHLSLQREEELEEVPEETLAEHNLSSVLDKPTDADEGSSSSESEMEGEDEEQEEEHEILHSPRDTQGASWLESGQLAPNVKEGSPLGAKVQDRVEAGVVAEAQVQEVDDDEEEEEEEEDDDDDDEEDLVKSPGMHFFPEPHVENKVKQESTLQAQDTMGPASPDSPLAPVPLVCLQPELQLETVAPKSPIRSQSFTCSPPSNPLSPVCSQPLPCEASSIALSLDSPVQGQPGPAVASTPLAKSPPGNNTKVNRLLESAEQTPVKKADLIEEFWMKSAEIRKSLGLTPLERSRGPERIVMAPTSDLLSPKVNTPQDLPEELKPVFSGRAVIRRLNITVEGQVVSPPDKEPKSTSSDKRDLSSSSGLGLNGSLPTSQTFNTSDSTMLTPPSSPPPPPPNEEPAMLSDTSHVSWDRKPEPVEPPEDSTQSPASSPSPAPAPVEVQAAAVPVPAPRTIPVSAVILRRETSKPRQDEKRKSFVESVEEIPFADDVDDTYDYRTPDNSLQEKFYTPPTSKPQRERPPLHLALAMENGKPNIPRRHRDVSEFSPEAKEIAEERMRAREKNVKSQALKEAMAKQISKMKELDSPKGSSKVAWNVSSESSAKNEKPSVNVTPPKTSALKAQEARKHAETLPERFFSSHSSRSLEGSAASSEGSTGCKSKKRSSLFSPRKSKKEKKVKSEGRTSEKNGQEDLPKHKSLWKTVFAGYKKEKKKKDDKSWPSTPSSVTTVDSGKKRTSPLGRSSDLNLRRNLSFSEDSDLSCDDVLERSKADSVYVPHALAFKRGYAIKKKYTEEELNAKLTRRVQKAARRQAKQEELKRLHRAQIIQRQLEQVEEKQRQLEERGVAVEKALRGEAGMGKKDDPKLMQEWFKLVQEKNALVRYESELMIFARELELEDRQSRLQQELRERMAVEDHLKSEAELSEEKQILNEMLEVVEQRDALVALLEEQRLREKEEDRDLEAVMLSKGFDLNWA
ncbi:protein-methionine sulfoxide oxidase MICAL3-like [Scleropages formosus]|uniref:F-actin monooxygenase n=1 Tax=Scleropages formosus TaxID=113540 RepID=A0A0P7ZA51_SCLFO|nr:protein-methionine sulfoxide oxidase MICAL3-like [Scleropages formosus]